VLALLALQLLMCALLMLPARCCPIAQGRGANGLAVLLVGVGCAAGAGVPGALALASGLAATGAVLALAAAWTLLRSPVGPAALMLAWWLVLSAAYLAFLQYCEQRFRAVQGVGWRCTPARWPWWPVRRSQGGWACSAPAGLDRRQPGRAGGVAAGADRVLVAAGTAGGGQRAAVGMGVVARRRRARLHRQTLATARLGLFSSVGAFRAVPDDGFHAVTQWRCAQ
jgi:hypothetical protein